MKKELGGYTFDAQPFSSEEVVELSQKIAKLSGLVRNYLSVHRPWLDMATFRSKLQKKETEAPSYIAKIMAELRELTEKMVCGYGRIAYSQATAFRAVPGSAQHDDYCQECLIAIDLCCFGYDGSTMFSTYATTAMKNRLIAVRNKQNKNKEQLESEMGSLEHDSPLSFIADQRKVVDLSELKTQDDLDKIMALAGLTDLEKELIEMSLVFPKNFRAKVAASHINPTTKAPLTRAWTAIVYKTALQKLRTASLQLDRQAA